MEFAKFLSEVTSRIDEIIEVKPAGNAVDFLYELVTEIEHYNKEIINRSLSACGRKEESIDSGVETTDPSEDTVNGGRKEVSTSQYVPFTNGALDRVAIANGGLMKDLRKVTDELMDKENRWFSPDVIDSSVARIDDLYRGMARYEAILRTMPVRQAINSLDDRIKTESDLVTEFGTGGLADLSNVQGLKELREALTKCVVKEEERFK